MGKQDSRAGARAPPIADFRQKTGRHHQKLGKQERTETQTKAIARKQEFPIKQLLLGMLAFGAACALLFAYLSYVLAEEEEEESMGSPGASAPNDAG